MEDLNVNPFNHSEPGYNESMNHTKQLLRPKTFNEGLIIFHQNIRGRNINKLDELFISSSLDFSHIICLTGHHLRVMAVDTSLFT
jgi:hypothetical protein